MTPSQAADAVQGIADLLRKDIDKYVIGAGMGLH